MHTLLFGLLFLLPVVLWIALPAVRGVRPPALPAGGREADELRRRRERVLSELRDLEMDRETGKMREADYRALREALESEAIEVMSRESGREPREASPGAGGERPRGRARKAQRG